MLENLPSNAGNAGLISGQGTKIPHAAGQLPLVMAAQHLKCTELYTLNGDFYEVCISLQFFFFRKRIQNLRLPRWCSGKESACQCRRHKRRMFDPWVGKMPGGRKWQPTPVFLPEKFHRGSQWATVHGITQSRTQLSTHTHTHTELTLLAMRQ